MLSYACSENLTSSNKKIIRRKVDGIEASSEKSIEERNRHNEFYLNVLPSIYRKREDVS